MSPRTRAQRPTIRERAVFSVLDRMRCGSLTLALPNGAERTFGGSEPGPDARVDLRSDRTVARVAASGGIGLAEAYMDGGWDTPDLDAVLEWGTVNVVEKPVTVPPLLAPAQRVLHSLRDNHPTGAKRNISYHYDLGNDFYRLWLDPTMTYSCAAFRAPATPRAQDELLRDAQVRKWDRLLELLQPSARDRILEIGCGWGGFAVHAAKQAGCRVVGVTISEEQRAWAARLVESEGLEGRVEIRRQDYRHVPDRFDAIASIEMFEAVGERWWPAFFARVRDSLNPRGVAAMQVITIDDARFENYRRNPDFTQRYIFPGGMLPSPERFTEAAAAAGLDVSVPRTLGSSYARTLERWREGFEAALPDVRALGFDDRFIRMWRYYLAYCRAGFEHGTIDVMQVRLTR